ncbi:hypothetical protein HHI36_010165 [Cryptolaemus montrouzieri]|uniref:Uncharacterized protein n=1 Tax=Cryptolaemus montrouzieri TaxID=559131 RepID=A0ABD2MIP8_9CUCU
MKAKFLFDLQVLEKNMLQHLTLQIPPQKWPKPKSFDHRRHLGPNPENEHSSHAPLFNEIVNLIKSIQSKRADIKDEYSLNPSTTAEIGTHEQHGEPHRAAFSGLSQFPLNPPMSFVALPWQSPAASINSKTTQRSPGYSESSSTSQSQSPLNSSMTCVLVSCQSPIAPVNTNPTELPP